MRSHKPLFIDPHCCVDLQPLATFFSIWPVRINFELWPVKANTQRFLKRKYFTRHGCLIRLGIAIVLMAKKKHDGWYVFLLKIPDFSLKLYFFKALFARTYTNMKPYKNSSEMFKFMGIYLSIWDLINQIETRKFFSSNEWIIGLIRN